MVNAELIHNPYLLHTSVKFNGHAPRINSQIEKYENQTLKDWVEKIPAIFYDEMNGYDFDLDFTGTLSDFEEVRQVFVSAGVTQEDVRLFLKNELEDADEKSQKIDELLQWLAEHPNRKFDFGSFHSDHAELFESTYPYIVIRGSKSDSFDSQISLESINSVDELRGTLLTDIPILFFVEESTMKQFRDDLTTILERKDVNPKQLFFMLHPNVNAEQTVRVICDLGIDFPQIVSSINDSEVMAFLRNYPITEYIREAIKVFETTIGDIKSVLDVEISESEIMNAEIHSEINTLEDDISRLKYADELFVERDNFGVPQKFADLLVELEAQIKKWRNRKTKVNGEYECEIAAKEYDSELKKYVRSFLDGIRTECRAVCADIFESFRDSYSAQGIDSEYTPKHITFEPPAIYVKPPLAEEFIALKEISYEEPKSDLFNIFLRGSSKEDREPIRVVTCYYEQWRSFAAENIMPTAENYVQDVTAKLRQYYDNLAIAYHAHLTELITEWNVKKDAVSAKLSEDEKKLQEDNDWLHEFEDQLFHIERG